MGTDPIYPSPGGFGKWGLSPFICGAASVAAFAPLGVYPLLIASAAFLVHLWSNASPRRAFVTGLPAVVAGLATLIFCAFLALFPAAAGWLQGRIPASPAVRACLLIPAAW